MKSIEETLELIAQRKGCDDFDLLVRRMPTIFIINSVKEAMQEYAKQVAEAQRENCALRVPGNMVYKEYREDLHEALLTTPLVTDNI